MIRCSDLAAIGLIACAPLTARAQDFVADAFGLYTPDAETAGRAQWSGLQTGATGGTAGQARIRPGPAETLVYILGPKRLVAGMDRGNGVAIVLDAHGNPTGDGETVRFRLGPMVHSAPIRAGMADFLFTPPVQAGQYFSGATTATRQSTRAEINVTADIGSVAPTLLAPDLQPFPPEGLNQLRAGNLTDRFGNTVEDGIAMTFDFRLDNGSFARAVAVAQQGLATADLLTRDIAGSGLVTAHLGARRTAPEGIAIAAPVAIGPAEIMLIPVPDIDASRLRAGPFRTQHGYVLNDGAAISVVATDATGARIEIQGWLLNGCFETLLPVKPGTGPVRLEIFTSLGLQRATLTPDTGGPPPEEEMQ